MCVRRRTKSLNFEGKLSQFVSCTVTQMAENRDPNDSGEGRGSVEKKFKEFIFVKYPKLYTT